MRSGCRLAIAALCIARAVRAEEPADVTVRGLPNPTTQAEVLVSGEQAAQGAGTQGDPLKATQSLPGVGRGGIGGGEIVAWGSEPRESVFQIDGIEIPRLYHGSGVRSVIQPELVEALSLNPGAFGPEYGRAVGGLVLVQTAPADSIEPRMSVGADTLDARALASAPLVSGKSAARIGGRYGYVDRWLPPLIDPALRGLYVVPRYWDAHAEVQTELRSAETLRLVALGSSDESATEIFASDPSRAKREERELGFGRIYARYSRRPKDGAEIEATPFVGWDTSRVLFAFGEQPSRLNVEALRYGLRARHRSRLTDTTTLAVGVDGAGSVANVVREGSPSVPRREGDPYPFGTPPGSGFARDEFRTHIVGTGVYAEIDWRARILELTPSVRLEPTLIESSRTRPPIGTLPDIGVSRLDLLVLPRLSAELLLSRQVRLFAAGGRYAQPPDPADLGARFGNPRLDVATATHLVAGERVLLATKTRIEVSLFAKWLSDLPIRAADPEPRLAQTLLSGGRGRAYGSQIFVRQAQVGGFNGWLSATVSRSERSTPVGDYRLSDYDSPLVMALAAQQVLGDWRFGSRLRFASGLPRTPVIGAYYDLASNTYQPMLGATNTSRLADFVQLDLRIDRRFSLGSATTIELYLDMLNVTGRTNQEEVVYSSDFRLQGSVSGLPPLAILGVSVER